MQEFRNEAAGLLFEVLSAAGYTAFLFVITLLLVR